MKLVFKQGVTLGGSKVANKGEEIEMETIPTFLQNKVEMVEDNPTPKPRTKKVIKKED